MFVLPTCTAHIRFLLMSLSCKRPTNEKVVTTWFVQSKFRWTFHLSFVCISYLYESAIHIWRLRSTQEYVNNNSPKLWLLFSFIEKQISQSLMKLWANNIKYPRWMNNFAGYCCLFFYFSLEQTKYYSRQLNKFHRVVFVLCFSISSQLLYIILHHSFLFVTLCF